MIYLGNHRNLLRTALLSASNVVASQVVFRSDTDEKAGGGLVTLSGDYTGATDATFDVEITNGASSTPRVSAPVFVGVGNGQMSNLSASGLGSQQITVSLYDLGTETRAAYHPFQSVRLEAREEGEGGNSITLSIDTSGLTSTATDWATQGQITAGNNEYRGDEWNFGAVPLTPDGKVPATAPRIRFGFDPQVYRAYSRFLEGQYVYSFSPAPIRDVPRGTPVYSVSGSRTVTITDGTDTDTLPNIVTVFDCLRAINSSSALVKVVGVIADDRAPGGMGASELSVWTQPYVVSVARSESEYVQAADLGISLAPTVPTEQLVIRCADARTPGQERWAVRGEVSGPLALATTGLPYHEGGYRFLIPVVPNPEGAANGTIHVKFRRPVENQSLDDPGWRGAVRSLLGAAARTGSYTFTYRPRPPEDCEEPGEMVGGPNAACLGITPPGDTQMSAARLLQRRQRLSRFVRGFVHTNTADVPAEDTSSVDQDITYIKKAAQSFAQVLDDLEADAADSLQPAARANLTAYTQDQQITVAISGADYLFYASTPGTSAGSSPDFSGAADPGETVTDGGVTWTNNGKTALSLWDQHFALLEADATNLEGIASTAVSDWDPTTAYALNTEKVKIGHGGLYVRFVATTGGTSGGSEPDWSTADEDGDTVSDGSVVWTRVGADSYGALAEGTIDEFYYERYITACNEIKAAAGLSANFDLASDQGDGCWRDADVSAWFEFDGDEPRSPVIPNVYYHASLMDVDEAGNTLHHSTREFGFGAKFGCPENLAEGDQIIVQIVTAGPRPTYQEGDSFTIQSTRATPLAFGGGQTGTDLLKWSVTSDDTGEMFLDYEMDIADPENPSSYSNNGLTFDMSLGAIRYALGDTFTLSIEAAQYRTRKNGGAWSSAADIPAAPVVLSDGLSITFTPGRAPSWVADDRWTFTAEATNGVDQLRQPTDGRLAWTGSTVITVTPDEAEPIEGILIAEHSIPEGATILLEGSDDNFATSPLSVAIPWRAGCIWKAVDGERAKYRVSIDESGSISWCWLGQGFQPTLTQTGAAELGRLVKRRRLPSLSRRTGLGGTVTHEGLSDDAETGLLALLEHATENDEGRFGIVPNESLPESGIVEYVEESLELEDIHGFQPADPAQSLRSVSLELRPIP